MQLLILLSLCFGRVSMAEIPHGLLSLLRWNADARRSTQSATGVELARANTDGWHLRAAGQRYDEVEHHDAGFAA
jgi:hypothetical protein